MTRDDDILALPSGLLVLTGFWLIASPWMLETSPALDLAVWNCVIAGILIALIAGSELWGAAKSHALSAFSGVLGIWIAYEDRPLWAGEFRGVGPKGWQRSDDEIKADVCTRMADHARLDPSEIDVVVLNGEVALLGSVPDRSARRLAEDIVDSVSGVRDVVNELRVQRAGDGIRRVA